VVHPTVAANSLKELIALAKKEPGKLTYGSGGAGTPNHLTGVMFDGVTGTTLVHVPFRGSGERVRASADPGQHQSPAGELAQRGGHGGPHLAHRRRGRRHHGAEVPTRASHSSGSCSSVRDGSV